MNPFELAGPQFLAFYATLGAGVLFAVYVLKQHAEGGEPIRLPSTDPYLIAYLRGGATEAVRLGVAVLVDRQLLELEDGDRVARRERVMPTHGSNVFGVDAVHDSRAPNRTRRTCPRRSDDALRRASGTRRRAAAVHRDGRTGAADGGVRRGCSPDRRVSIRTRIQASDDEHVLVRHIWMWLVERKQLRRGRKQLWWWRGMWRLWKFVTLQIASA